MNTKILGCLIVFLLSAFARADDIVLVDGRYLQVKVLGATEKKLHVKLLDTGGELWIPWDLIRESDRDRLMVQFGYKEEERGEIEIPTLEPRHIELLESWIDRWLDQLLALENFILPGGGAAAANLHLARTVCRRAERAVVKLGRDEKIGECALRYLNRLSDLLFVMARWENRQRGREETTWDSRV